MENKENKKIPEVKEIAKATPVEVYPHLFNVVGVEHGSQKIILYTRAHFTKEEAIEQFRLKATAKTGIPGHLWVIKVVTSISATDIEKEFIDIHDQVQTEKKKDKNLLMKEIIEGKDTNLLHRHYDRFNNSEIQYMHDKILNV